MYILYLIGTAKNLLNMFTKVNEDTKNMKAQLHKPSGVAKTVSIISVE